VIKNTWQAKALMTPQCLSSNLAVLKVFETTICAQFSDLLTLSGCMDTQRRESIVALLEHHLNWDADDLSPDVQYRELYFQELPIDLEFNFIWI